VIAERALPTGRWATIWPLTFGRARLVIARTRDAMSYDDAW